jgi:hypothetical protein
MLREDIERFNEWWFTGKIRKELALPFKRFAFSVLLNPRVLYLGCCKYGCRKLQKE